MDVMGTRADGIAPAWSPRRVGMPTHAMKRVIV